MTPRQWPQELDSQNEEVIRDTGSIFKSLKHHCMISHLVLPLVLWLMPWTPLPRSSSTSLSLAGTWRASSQAQDCFFPPPPRFLSALWIGPFPLCSSVSSWREWGTIGWNITYDQMDFLVGNDGPETTLKKPLLWSDTKIQGSSDAWGWMIVA